MLKNIEKNSKKKYRKTSYMKKNVKYILKKIKDK